MRCGHASIFVLFAALSAVFASSGCSGTTGDDIVDFPAFASGPLDASPSGAPLAFVTDRGWTVSLTKATLHIGALYLGQSLPVSGAQNTSCILPGTYVAQVTSSLDVDLLSSTPQTFPTAGHGTTLGARVGQVWLTGGDIATIDDPTPILQIAGTASRGTDVRPFTGQITISSNRQTTTGDTAGANPICKQRIVTPIPTEVGIGGAGGLILRVDPRFLFVNVDFSQLGPFSSGYGFSDDPTQVDATSPLYYSQPSINLYQNLHSAGGLYSFAWDANLHP